MEIKDNRELMRKAKAEKGVIAETCRVCGAKELHSLSYGIPTMDCIKYLRSEIAKLKDALALPRSVNGDVV